MELNLADVGSLLAQSFDELVQEGLFGTAGISIKLGQDFDSRHHQRRMDKSITNRFPPRFRSIHESRFAGGRPLEVFPCEAKTSSQRNITSSFDSSRSFDILSRSSLPSTLPVSLSRKEGTESKALATRSANVRPDEAHDSEPPRLTFCLPDGNGPLRLERSDKPEFVIVPDYMAEKSEGMFLWARLLVNYLQGVAITPQARQLAIIQVESLGGIETLYDNILRKLSQNSAENRKVAADIFTWTLNSLWPLTSKWMHTALAITPRQPIFDLALLHDFETAFAKDHLRPC